MKYIAARVEMQQSLVELQGMLLTGGLSDPDDDGVTTGSSDSSTLPLTDTSKTD